MAKVESGASEAKRMEGWHGGDADGTFYIVSLL